MKYNIEMLVVKPSINKPQKKEMKVNLEISFYCNPNDYGNGYRASVFYKDTGYSECVDLRYDTNFDEEVAELWITDYVYHNWCGKYDSYDIQKLTIERIEE